MPKLKNFIGQSYQSQNPQFDCSRTINMRVSVDENLTGTNQQLLQLLSTPGLTNAVSSGFNSGINGAPQRCRGGWTTSQGSSYCVVGNTLYYLSGAQAPYTPVPIGTLNTSEGFLGSNAFADNGQIAVLVDGLNGYYFYLNNAMEADAGITQITDPAWLGATMVQYYDGYFLFNQPGTGLFYWSNPNSISFNPLNFATKSGNPDPIAGLIVLQRQLWLIGTLTIEIWYDVGGTVTFQRLSGPYNEWGCIAPNSIAKSEFGIFLIAQNVRGGAQAFMTNGNSMVPIGTFAIAYQLQSWGQTITNATGVCYQHDGCVFYQINPAYALGAQQTSYVYDYNTSQELELPTWHERCYTVQPSESALWLPDGGLQRHLIDVTWMYNGQILGGSYRDANVYFFDNTNPSDNGAYRTQQRVGPHVMSDGNRMFFSLFRLLCQTGAGGGLTNIGSTSGGLETVAFSNITYYIDQEIGYSSPAFGIAFGNEQPTANINVSSLFGVTIGGIVGGDVSEGPGPSALNVYLLGAALPQDLFVSVSGVTSGCTAVPFTLYTANTTSFEQNVLGSGYTWWSWTGVPSQPVFPDSGSYSLTFSNEVSTSISKGASANVSLQWSDDGGYTWSNPLPMSLGAIGQYNQLVEWYQLGCNDVGRNRVFRVTCTDYVHLNLMDAIIRYQTTNPPP